ncbi:MAG TPA: hypothetical protein VNS58_18845 [Puia sp.]|nr:hypothetical protein [Puia sp.]
MNRDHHLETASGRRNKDAPNFRQQQKTLVDEGKLQEAQEHLNSLLDFKNKIR